MPVYVAVISAAVLHALWNALAKGGSDQFESMTAVVLGQALIAIVILPFVPAPSVASWPFLLASLCLHLGYQFFLLAAYRAGELTQVYPIARGTAPLIVAGVSTVYLGASLSRVELLAVLAIGAGLISLGIVRQDDGLRNAKAGLLAFLTGCFIAGYSISDGLGARQAGTVLGYFGWLTIGNAVAFAAIMGIIRPQVFGGIRRRGKRVFLIGGNASFLAYALVIWAFTQAPIALVTALRETSIVFALFIGVVVLNERLDLHKLAAVMFTLFGAVLLRLAPIL